MKKTFSTAIVAIILGVIIFGSGSAVAVIPEDVTLAHMQGTIYIGINSSASFLAPIPVTTGQSPMPHQYSWQAINTKSDHLLAASMVRAE